jgi:hypothetical protein
MARGVRENYPTIGVSRLRATGAIRPDGTSIELFERPVGVVHRKFPNGGSWSFFVAPCCGRRARTLRLVDERIVCRWCDGLIYRCQAEGKAERIARLCERLYGAPLRLKPRSTRKLERARALEASLRRALIVERRQRLAKAVAD